MSETSDPERGQPDGYVTDAELVDRMGRSYGEKYWIAWLGFFKPRSTRVTDGTTRLLWATFVPPEVPPPDFEEFAATMIRFNGGAVDQNTVFHTS